MRRFVFRVDFGEKFTSGGIIFVEVLDPDICLLSDKTTYSTSITDSVVGAW